MWQGLRRETGELPRGTELGLWGVPGLLFPPPPRRSPREETGSHRAPCGWDICRERSSVPPIPIRGPGGDTFAARI